MGRAQPQQVRVVLDAAQTVLVGHQVLVNQDLVRAFHRWRQVHAPSLAKSNRPRRAERHVLFGVFRGGRVVNLAVMVHGYRCFGKVRRRRFLGERRRVGGSPGQAVIAANRGRGHLLRRPAMVSSR